MICAKNGRLSINFRVDPALRLASGKDPRTAASQFMLSRLENDVLGSAMGLEALKGALTRATDTLLKRKNQKRLIIDPDSTEDLTPGKQEGVAYNGPFAKNCVHPLFGVTSKDDCLGARLRPGGCGKSAQVSCHARRWYVHVASAFAL
jgi:hypothetical protein